MFPAALPSATINIMPVGDSITQGLNTSYGSYRRYLYDLLNADGIAFNFVGSLSDGSFPDPQHDGITGDVINGAWGRVQTGHIIEVYDADMILLLIGTNDVWHGSGDISAALVTYGHLLDQIITDGPNVKTVVGTLPPIDVSVAGSTVSSNINVFNAGLVTLVASKGANFSLVDINAGLTTSDLADGVHPTDAGNDKMAVIWESGIIQALGGFVVDGSSAVLTDDSGNNLLAW
jgi:lysophospholipase L1-like esterase